MTDLSEVFPWNTNFNTGIESIDEQHRQLVRLINLLASHIIHQSDSYTLNSIFTELSEYAVYHFRTEEAIWFQYFPDDELEIEHKQAHSQFIQAVLELKSGESNKPQEQIFSEILTFLTHWLAYHILDNDMRLAKAVLGIQTGLSLEEAKLQAKQEMSGAMKRLIETILSMYDALSSQALQLMMDQEDTRARLAIANALQQGIPLKERFIQTLAILFKLKSINLQHKGGLFLRSEGDDGLDINVIKLSNKPLIYLVLL
jgi:hemerythrin-like metal-binding protein